MSRAPFHCLFALLIVVAYVPAMGSAQSQTEPSSNIITVKIEVNKLAMIAVPVSIN